MKFSCKFLVILFALSCLSCSSKKLYLEHYVETLKEERSSEVIQQLNDSIYKAQKNAILISDLTSSASMYKELETQQKYYRTKYLPIVNDLIKKYPNKPLLIYESFDFICLGCGANYVALFNGEVYARYRLSSENMLKLKRAKYKIVSYEKDNTKFDFDGSEDILTLYNTALKDDNWNQSSRRYGTDECFDGSQSFYTILNLDGKMKSMYMRCWTGKQEKE